MKYQRDKLGILDFQGMNLVRAVDMMPTGKLPFAQNVRRYLQGGIMGRSRQTLPIMTLTGGAVHTVRRLNDTTPAVESGVGSGGAGGGGGGGGGVTPGGLFTLAPPQISFGTIPQNTFAEILIEITFAGTGPEQLTSVSLSNSSFTLQSLPALPFTFASSGSFTGWYVGFNQPAGSYSAVMSIVTSLGSFTVNISATAVVGTLVVSPTQLTFGSTVVGGTSASQAIHVTNNESGYLDLGGYDFESAPYTPSHDFAFQGAAQFPMSIAPGQTLDYHVVATPQAVGTRTATLTILTSVAGVYVRVTLSVTAVASRQSGALRAPGTVVDLPSETDNNTSAYSAYNASGFPANFSGVSYTSTTTTTSVDTTQMDDSMNPVTPAHVSANSVKAMVPNFTGKWYAHVVPWFGSSSHISIGVNNQSVAWVDAMLADISARGFDGIILDWYGQGSFEDGSTLVIQQQIQTYPAQTFAIMVDRGSYSTTAQLEAHLAYIHSQYFSDPRYMTYNGLPVVFFFGVASGVDYAAARASVAQSMFWMFEGPNASAYVDGTFGWPNPWSNGVSQVDPYNLAADNSYLSQVTGGKPCIPHVSPGFNGTLTKSVAWSLGKYMPRDYGKCWLTKCDNLNSRIPSNAIGIQVATWNDWEEGSQIESPIQNGIRVIANLSGTTLQWTVSGGTGDETTLTGYRVIAADGSGDAWLIYTEAIGGAKVLDLSTITGFDSATTYSIYVVAVGVASVRSQMSNSVSYTSGSGGGGGGGGGGAAGAGRYLIAGAGPNLWLTDIVTAAQIDTGYSGKPLSLLPFRPSASVQPWMYVGDSVKMSKVRSDKTVRKMGIKEPQAAPAVSLVPASDVVSLLGNVTVYFYNNPSSAHNPPLQSIYLPHNPADKGPTTLMQTAADANGSNEGNSLLFDEASISGSGAAVDGHTEVQWTRYTSYVGTVSTIGTEVTWDSGDEFLGLVSGNKIVISGVTYIITGAPTNTTLTLNASAGTQVAANYTAAVNSGSVALFSPQMESQGFQDFNCAILGTFYVPQPGTYSFYIKAKDDFMWGIGNSPNGKVSWPGLTGTQSYSSYGQSMTCINGYALIPRQHETSGEDGYYSTITINITFSAAGNYPFEIDWDYWYHPPRGLMVQVNGQEIPPVPPSAITNSQYIYRYRASETGAKSNGSPASPQSPLSVLANTVAALFSYDPQVDKIDFYRLDEGLSDYTYVGTIQNYPASTTLLSAVTIAGAPFQVLVSSVTGITAGTLLAIDNETVVVISTGFAYETSTTISAAHAVVAGGTPAGTPLTATYTVASTAGFNVGDVVQVAGVVGSGPFSGTYPITAIGAGTITVQWGTASGGGGHFQTIYSGSGGAMANVTTSVATITAIFQSGHGAGATATAVGGQLMDDLLDTDVAANPLLEYDNFEPFPVIDVPRKGFVDVVSGVVRWASGDYFDVRWLPGTIIIVGTIAYTLNTRPTSTTSLTCQNLELINGVETVVTPPTGLGLRYEIAEPILAAQPLPYMWGPTDNVAFAFGCGDSINPGTLYWSKGNDLDSAPDTNQQNVTSPSEPLQNGCIVNGMGMVFSPERAWLIWPNYFTALATVTGTQGNVWTLQISVILRGLYIPRAIAVDGAGNVYFRAKDGLMVSPGGSGAKSITDDDLYNLFPHEGKTPKPVVIGKTGRVVYPPDDTQPDLQKLSCANGYLYYDYVDTTGTPRTLTLDIVAGGWVWDVYQAPVTVHALEEGPDVNTTLVGCYDGTVRTLSDTGPETGTVDFCLPANNAGDTRARKQWGDVYMEVEQVP